MEEELKVGEHPKNVYWAVRGNTGVSSQHLDKFHECGVRSKAYNGYVWVVENLKFLRPFDTVKPQHMTLLGYYTGYQLNDRPVGYLGPLPFGTFSIVDYRAMVVVGGDGPNTYMWSEWKNDLLYVHNGDQTTVHSPLQSAEAKMNNKTDNSGPGPEPEPEPTDSDQESDDGMFSLFDDGDTKPKPKHVSESESDDDMVNLFD